MQVCDTRGRCSSCWSEGYDGVYVASRYRNPFHHTVEDRLERIDVALLERISVGVCAALEGLADAPAERRAP